MIEKITPDNLHLFTYTNIDICKPPLKGIVLAFHGLGFTGMFETTDLSQQYAEKGIIFVHPYYGPWSWMNDTAVKTVDSIIDAIFEKCSLPETTPVISTGGSMGGLSALIYTRYTKRTPAACAANCPVCDLVYHSDERDDLPRTILHAFTHYSCDLKEAVKSASPVHQVDFMPDIPYYIVHGDADTAVNKKYHSDVFVKAMKQKKHTIIYKEIPGMIHCNLTGSNLGDYNDFILHSIGL